MNKNIEFNYLYRDASNYKSFGSIVFTNPYSFSICFIDSYFDFENLFIADQISVPEIFLYGKHDITIDDHCYHEYEGIKETEKASNDEMNRTINEFIWEVQFESFKGWNVFDPIEREIWNCTSSNIKK